MTMKLKKASTLAISTVLVSVLALAGCQSTHHTPNPDAQPTKKMMKHNNNGIHHTHSKYANERSLTIAGQDFPVSETSARLLTNQAGDAPELVADIFDGKANIAVPGYQIMVINRTSSIAAEGRTLDDGRIIDNRMIHRGSKALIGIPVVDDEAQLDRAYLLDLDVIYDNPAAALPTGESVKPRGEKLTKSTVAVTDKKVTINELTLPNFESGENAGGGIDFVATASVDGQPVSTAANSAFQIFYTTTPDKARGF